MDKLSTLVILPGLDGTDVFFRPLLALLPRTIRPLVLCYPQTGPNGYADLLGFVRGAVAEIPEFYVLGSSFSGPLAVMLAAAEPQKVRGIILSATFLRSPRRQLNRFRFAAIGPVIWAIRVARRIPVWTRRSRDDPFRRAKRETWSRVSARCLAGRVRAILAVDVRDVLRICVQPVLCIVFGSDRVVARNSSEEILLHRPATKRVTLPGDHFAFYSDPARFADAVVRFMQSGESVK
jgi:pimeloyl-[acyl-carrier protein] methyl ester esterase